MAIAAAADKRHQPAAIQTSSRGYRQLHLWVVENLMAWSHGLDGNGMGWARWRSIDWLRVACLGRSGYYASEL